MRTLSFENLRRLVGRRKDRDEPSFERSESFKRISIRKSYLDRGKRRTRLQKSGSDGPEVAAAPVQIQVEVSSRLGLQNVVGPTIVQVRGNDSDDKKIIREEVVEIEEEGVDEDYDEDVKKKRGDTPAGTIIYGQWLNDADSSYSSKDRKYGLDSYSSRDSKFDSSREKIYITQDSRPPYAKRNFNLPTSRKINNDEVSNKRVSSVLIELDKSPQLPRSQSRIQEKDETDSIEDYGFKTNSKECTCGEVTNVNVGTQQDFGGAADRTYSISSNQESNLEDRFNERSIVSRTVSAPEKPACTKTDTTSTKASGFSLSLSFSRLTTDLRAAAVTTRNGLFRRRKRTSPMKPAPSVSAEGYFERTAGATVSSMRRSRRSAAGSARRRPGYASRRRKPVIKPSPAPVRDSSPVWFVPPERRRSSRQRGRVWREVRYLPQSDGGDNADARSNDSSTLSDEFDDKKLLLSGDFEEKAPPSNLNRKLAESSLDSSSLISSAASCLSLKPKISDFNEDKIFYEEYRGDKSKPIKPNECNYFASSQFLGFVAGNSQRCGCSSSSSSSSSSESDPEDQRRRVVLVVGGGGHKDLTGAGVGSQIKPERRNCSVVLVLEGQSSRVISRQEVVGPKRRPLRRKSQVLRKSNAAPGNNPRQPVYLARRRSSLRRRPCSKDFIYFYDEQLIMILKSNY